MLGLFFKKSCSRPHFKILVSQISVPSFAHEMLTDMASNKTLKLKYNTISQERCMLTKKAIPTLLADEGLGNMLDEYNKLYKNKR